MATLAPPLPRAAPNVALVTVSVMLATIMQVLDSTIANVALPHMQASLGAARDTITWVLTSYIVASAVALPITGWLSDRLGRKRLFLWAIGGFVVASMLCGIAQNLTQMVAFRVLQGIAGAFLVPLSQAAMLDVYPKEKHGQAMALWGMGIMLGPIMGPVLGGWLTENFDWRWVFFVNLPVGVLAFAGVAASLDETPLSERRLDLIGFGLLAIGVTALQLMLDRGERLDWFNSVEVLVEGGLAVGALWMFGVHLATAREPLFAASMFRDRNYTVSLSFMFLLGMLLFSTMALLPPMLQTLYGYPVITAGEVIAPRGAGTLIAMTVVGRVVQRVDPRGLVLLGLILTAWAMHMMSGFSLEMDWTLVAFSGFVQGVGFGLMVVPLNLLAFATLPPHMRTDASSLYNLARNIGSSIGISIVTVLLAQNLQTSHADLAAHITPYTLPMLDPMVAERIGSSSETGLAMVDAEVNRQALLIAYIDDFWLQFIGTLVVIPLVFFLRRPGAGAEAGPPME